MYHIRMYQVRYICFSSSLLVFYQGGIYYHVHVEDRVWEQFVERSSHMYPWKTHQKYHPTRYLRIFPRNWGTRRNNPSTSESRGALPDRPDSLSLIAPNIRKKTAALGGSKLPLHSGLSRLRQQQRLHTIYTQYIFFPKQ